MIAALNDISIARLSLIGPEEGIVLIYPIYEIILSGITIYLILLCTCSLRIELFKCELRIGWLLSSQQRTKATIYFIG